MRYTVLVSLLSVVMLQIPCIKSLSICYAEEVDYDKLWSNKNYYSSLLENNRSYLKIAKEKSKEIQDSLYNIYNKNSEYKKDYNRKGNPLSDKKIGRTTLKWINKFGIDFKFVPTDEFPDDMIKRLSFYAAMPQQRPEINEIILSDDFQKWVNSQLKSKKIEIYRVMSYGTEQQILNLIDNFYNVDDRARRSPTVDKQQIIQPERKDGFAISYKLTEVDLQKLKSTTKQDLSETLMKELKGKKFQDKNQFISEVNEILNNIFGKDEYVPPTPEQVEESKTYKLTDKSFRKPKMNDIPDAIIDKLKKLQNETYENLDELNIVVEKRIKEVTNKYESIIIDSVQQSTIDTEDTSNTSQDTEKKTISQLTEKSFIEMKRNDIPDIILSKLEPLKKEEYSKDYNELIKKVSEIIKSVIEQYKKDIKESAEETVSYKLTNQYIDNELKTSEIPEIILWVLNFFKDIEYPDETLFMDALKAKIISLILQSAESQMTFSLTEKSFEKLKALDIPESIFVELENLKNITYETKDKFREAVREAVGNGNATENKIELLFGDYQSLIVQNARKKHKFDEKTKSNWKGKSNGGYCGCVSDDLGGIVYGFYPFWLASDVKKKVDEQTDSKGNKEDSKSQNIDFSLLSRIGYYALTFADYGEIEQMGNWSVNQADDFVKQAHRHRTKVDLIIYKNNWSKWLNKNSKDIQYIIIDKLITNIVNLLTMQLTDTRSKMIPYISLFSLPRDPWDPISSFSIKPVPGMGNGLTMNFDAKAEDKKSIERFGFIIKKLKKKMREKKTRYTLNIMLMSPLEETVSIIKQIEEKYGKIDVLLDEKVDKLENNMSNKVKNNRIQMKVVDFYLVFLNEPTTESKKQLRQKIENNFKGKFRKKVLRKIIPVIIFDGYDEQQLKDDIVYFKDNFGGVGFWPVPIINGDGDTKITDKIAGKVNDTLKDFYRKDKGKTDDKALDEFCKWVCTHRWNVRISWDIFISIFMLSILLYFRSCGVQYLFRKDLLLFFFILVLTSLFFFLSFSLLYCDPYYMLWKEGNVLLFIFIIACVFIGISFYRRKKKLAKMP